MTERSKNPRPDFSKTMTDILNFGAINLAMAIGYRTRLFDVMDDLDGPRPLSVIAEKAGLDGRYVKEWLGVMVTGGIVDLSRGKAGEGEDLFHLPRAHADVLTRRSGNANLGVYTQEIPLLTECAMAPVIHGFRTGNGVPYETYPEFQAFMAQLADAKHRQVLVDTFLPSVDNGRVLEALRQGIRVCDVGCAEGLVIRLMAEAFPSSRFVGIDISSTAIRKARQDLDARGLGNAEFHTMDAAGLANRRDLAGAFDYVTAFDAIHDQTRPLDALRGVAAILKEGGRFSMIDIAADSRMAGNRDHPMGPFLYTVSLLHCMPVGRVNGGEGLGMMWGRQKAVEMLREAGLRNVDVRAIPGDPFNDHFFCIK